MASFDYDVVIIGSGFGGSGAALRAAEKGYRVGVMESGRRWKDEDIPKSQRFEAAAAVGVHEGGEAGDDPGPAEPADSVRSPVGAQPAARGSATPNRGTRGRGLCARAHYARFLAITVANPLTIASSPPSPSGRRAHSLRSDL